MDPLQNTPIDPERMGEALGRDGSDGQAKPKAPDACAAAAVIPGRG